MSTPDPQPPDLDLNAVRALLHWYRDMGIDVCVQKEPVDSFALGERNPVISATPVISAANAPPPTVSRSAEPARQASPHQASPHQASPHQASPHQAKPRPTTAILKPDAALPSTDEAIVLATQIAGQCQTIADLANAVAAFEGCPLKKGARSTVFGTGVPTAPLLVLGEAPGQDEDRLGQPFVGRAGLLLDKMLAAIGHTRDQNTYISNVIYWRPPGNRAPSDSEMMICKPFVERLIVLMQPQLILIAGATPLKALLGKTGIMKNRGQWQVWNDGTRDVDIMPTFHPAYLLRSPEAKRLVWNDLQAVRTKLRQN